MSSRAFRGLGACSRKKNFRIRIFSLAGNEFQTTKFTSGLFPDFWNSVANSLTFRGLFQIPWFFQAFQVGGNPEMLVLLRNDLHHFLTAWLLVWMWYKWTYIQEAWFGSDSLLEGILFNHTKEIQTRRFLCFYFSISVHPTGYLSTMVSITNITVVHCLYGSILGYSREYPPPPPPWMTLNWVLKNFRIFKNDSGSFCRIPNLADFKYWGIPEFCKTLNDFREIPKILGKFMDFQSSSLSIFYRISNDVHGRCVDIFWNTPLLLRNLAHMFESIKLTSQA